ncbi:uncharacterized protein [Miscanthus floridulus]|uniref:uncharacterized protein n=1 Tax=Miscanthus floridulus TaxID=154761 RepID=UPI0034598411
MLSELIELTSLIIWDEALMANRKCFEALDRTLRDIEKVKNPEAADITFGGKVVVLGGDLRQILPVVEGGTKQDVISAAIITSRLWAHVEVLSLNQNMRLVCSPNDACQQQEVAAFSRWILDIGEGKAPSFAKDGEDEPSWITIPEELLIVPGEDKLAAIVQSVYPNFETRYRDPLYLSQRAILAPTNELTDTINEYMVPLVHGREKECLSLDTIAKATAQHEAYDLLYPIEFLNSISGNNFPQHRIVLKRGVPIMLLCNLNQRAGLCNGTRLTGNAIYAEISDDLIDDKACLFDVGKVYVVKKFVVQNAKKSYRAVDKNLMIDITDYTTVELVRNPPHSVPEYIYRITPLRAIRPARVVFNLTGDLFFQISFLDRFTLYVLYKSGN